MAALSSKQKALRIAMAMILLAIIGMVVVGDDWVRAYDPVMVLAYWIFCFGLALGLVALALFDIRETLLQWGKERKENLRRLTRPIDEENKDENERL